MAAYMSGPGCCTLRTAGGEVLLLSADPGAADPAALASAVHGWLASGGGMQSPLDVGLLVHTGKVAIRAEVRRLD